jgi:urocanate hydratase
VGLVGNCAEIIPELASRGVLPDILTDQTSAHNLLNGYVPSSLNAEEAGVLRRENTEEYLSRSRESLARHFEGMLALQKMGSIVFEFGNNLRAAAAECGVQDAASAFTGFVETYLQPLLSSGLAPVRWIALSGEAADIRRLDDLALELLPDDALLARWIPLARKFVRFQGLPARVCWMGNDARVGLARQVNSLVAEGAFKAPLVIAVDHAGDGAGPMEEKEKILPVGNSAAVSRLLNAAPGASWLSLQVGAGSSQATVVLVADGSPQAAKNIPHALEDDSALKVLRLAARPAQ